MSATWIYLVTCIYNFVCFVCVLCFVYDEMVKLPILPCAEKLELVLSTAPYNGFYVSDSIALCWATFSAFHALLSSHVMTNKDD